MITYELYVGRLVEVRFEASISEEDVSHLVRRAKALAPEMTALAVFCVDVTRCRVLSGQIADAVTKVMRRSNPRIERLGFLLPPEGAVARLQVDRMIRETMHPEMRSFREAGRLLGWLGEVLDPDERARLAEFLAGAA
jgi:hypothetical protein